MSEPTVKITSIRNGDVLNRHDGLERREGLIVQVDGTCPPGAYVTVNGRPATGVEGSFTCMVLLNKRRNRIIAKAQVGKTTLRDEVTVIWDWQSYRRFRFSVDDNIQFLKDLGTNPDAYRSLFDHWYLAFWRQMHEQFGAKIHFNIYYQTDGFDLTEMPAKWRDEWEENSEWLRLSFHALADKPDRPYRNATYTQMAHDFDLVMGHIRRFAGNEVTSRATTVHWAECPAEAVRALRDRGIDVLIGIFDADDEPCTTGYYFDAATCRYYGQRDYAYDPELDVTFINCDMVVNNVELDAIEPALEKQAADPHTGELMELLIHEQYFRPDLPQYYRPDMKERVIRALSWVRDHGYEPAFWGEGFCGNQATLPKFPQAPFGELTAKEGGA